MRRNVNTESESLLQDLMATPVGRRWLLKAGLGSAAAIAAAHLPDGSTAPGDRRQPGHAAATRDAAGAASPARPRQERCTSRSGRRCRAPTACPTSRWSPTAPGYTSSPIRQPRARRSRHRAACLPLPTSTPSPTTSRTSPLPSNRGMLVSVQGTRGSDQVLVSQMMHSPEATTLAMARLAASSGNGLRSMVGSDEQLRTLGLSAAQVTAPEHVVQLDAVGDGHSTAVAMVMLHPNVSTIDPTSGTATKSLLGRCARSARSAPPSPRCRARARTSPSTCRSTNSDGSAAQIQIGNNAPITFNDDPAEPRRHGVFVAALQSAVGGGVKGVRNSGDLGRSSTSRSTSTRRARRSRPGCSRRASRRRPQPYSARALPRGARQRRHHRRRHREHTALLYGTYTEATAG